MMPNEDAYEKLCSAFKNLNKKKNCKKVSFAPRRRIKRIKNKSKFLLVEIKKEGKK